MYPEPSPERIVNHDRALDPRARLRRPSGAAPGCCCRCRGHVLSPFLDSHNYDMKEGQRARWAKPAPLPPRVEVGPQDRRVELQPPVGVEVAADRAPVPIEPVD